jgi:hypothetical protein
VSWRKAAAGGALLDGVREWTAIIGGLGAGLGAGLLIWQGGVGRIPGVVCLILAAGALVARPKPSWPGNTSSPATGSPTPPKSRISHDVTYRIGYSLGY